MDGNLYELARKQLLTEVKCENLETDFHILKQEPDLTASKKSYHFGPFAPPTVSQAGVSETDKMKRVHDWESLASSYRPQYHNQGMMSLILLEILSSQIWYYSIDYHS